MVDIWQCDAMGIYSDVRDTNGFFNTAGQKFLRGYQLTEAAGVAMFTTVYPGWYQGRTVLAQAPYNSKTGRRTTNERDGIFGQGGRQLMLSVSEHSAGYHAAFDIG